MLEQCHLPDLSVKNYGDNESGYVVGIVIRVVESMFIFIQANPHQKYLLLEDCLFSFKQTRTKNICYWKIDKWLSYASCKE